MRLLLILALLLSSLSVAQPASAHADQLAAGQHHSHGGDDGSSEDQEAPAVAHICPGCAFLGQPTIADAASLAPSLPAMPADPMSLQPFHARPVAPPPRAS